MKHIFNILIINALFLTNLQSQCTEPDASIWLDTWRSCATSANPISSYGASHWIQYDLGAVRNLSKSWVWNTNDPGRLNQGFQDVMVDYSVDGEEWQHWGEMTFPKAQGDAIYGGFPGPDLSNLSAQFILITALSNHGDENCYGLAEIKFNLMSELGEPNDDDGGGELQCDELADIEINEFLEIETEMTAAFLFLEDFEEIEEYIVGFEYRELNGDWIEFEIDEEIELEDLFPGTEYEFRFLIECDDEFYTSEIGIFETMACPQIVGLEIEEVTESEAFILWEEIEYTEFYIVELSILGEVIDDFDVEEPEVFLEDLEENTNYELRIGIVCGEDILWSETISFTTEMEKVISGVNDETQSIIVSQIRLFPNPTSGRITVRIKSKANDILNYTLSTIDGQVVARNVTKVSKGIEDLKLNVENLPDGTYVFGGLGINSRTTYSGKLIKVSP
ncbi:MAG: T9SS type A sorting domain-containing protein [Bacteroidota bacterium]